jgi:hypothetical protein
MRIAGPPGVALDAAVIGWKSPPPHFRRGLDTLTFTMKNSLFRWLFVTLLVLGYRPFAQAQSSAAFVNLDRTTQGNWKNVYGSRFWLVNHATNLASTTRILSAAPAETWAVPTSAAKALMMVSASSDVLYGALDRVAAGLTSTTNFTLTVAMNPTLARRISIYCQDWGNQGRSQRIEVVDTNIGRVLDTRTLSNFAGGAYLVWDVVGPVRFRITRLAGPDATVSAVFLDTGPFPRNSTPPTVQESPRGLSLNAGESFALGAAVTGEPPLAFRWLRNGTALPQATNATFISTNALLTQAGDYALMVSNAFGMVTSSVAKVMVAGRAKSIVSDLNNDGFNDLIFQNTPGALTSWLMDGDGQAIQAQSIYAGSLGDWRLAGVADFNSDRSHDLLFQNGAGALVAWLMDGQGRPTNSLTIYNGTTGDWRVVAVADLNSDGQADLVFQNAAGQVVGWFMDGQGHPTTGITIYGSSIDGWKVATMGDVNGDGIADLIWQTPLGSVVAWLMDGQGHSTIGVTLYGGTLAGWRIAGMKDLNGDGIGDLVWQNWSGSVLAWLMDGNSHPTVALSIYSGSLYDWLVH